MTQRQSLVALISVTVLLCAAGCSGNSAAPKKTSPRQRRVSAPEVVRARVMGPDGPHNLRRGTPVDAGFSGTRVFANRRVGFAIADLRSQGGATYPLITDDGGKTWRTDGPAMHINAAQGAVGVEQVGVTTPKIFFAWCGGCGNVIDLTRDAGKHWWRTFMPGTVLGIVGPGPIAFIKAPGEGARVYRSVHARRWRYSYTITGF